MEKQLNIENLSVYYYMEKETVKAVNNVNLTLSKGESIGIVGETGAGKTTLALSIMRLLPSETGRVASGSISYNGKDLVKASDVDIRAIRGNEISMIFQDPMTSLNPILTIGDQIAEVIKEHDKVNDEEAEKKAGDILEIVGIPRGRMGDYPHQFSGGMKQRVIIAIALACSPEILLADEPTTALDVTIQAQILAMIKKLRNTMNMSLILISHDLGVVSQVCDKVAIMYAGEILEFGEIEDIFKNPMHPYTNGLFNAIPSLNKKVHRLQSIQGLTPNPAALPKGCTFEERCTYKMEVCKENKPQMIGDEKHKVACFYCEKNKQK